MTNHLLLLSNAGQQEGDDADNDNASAVVVVNNHDNAAAPPADAADPPAAAAVVNNHAPSNRLVRIRDNFNASDVRKKARSKSTFEGHQRNNVRLVLYLYEKNVEILVDELRRELDDTNAEPDYSDTDRRHSQYVRRGGKKSLDESKEEFRESLLKEVISNALGNPGTTPSQRVVDSVMSSWLTSRECKPI